MARSRSGSESSIDESFFLQTYVPLSNLPTPPLGYSNNSTRQQSPEALCHDEVLDPELLGPAAVLASRIPSATSLTPASVPFIQSILSRASLPLETIALAACILDSLNAKFALAFRHGCPLTPPPPSARSSNFHHITQSRHIDAIHPELLTLSALILAVKFLDDEQQTTACYAIDWGMGMWTCAQINYTQWSILENIGFKILHLWVEDLITDILGDMQRASKQYEPLILDEENETTIGNETVRAIMEDKRLNSGTALFGLQDQITPAETPVMEDCEGLMHLSLETK